MKVVIDSNIFVSSLNSFSPYHYIFQQFAAKNFDLVISTDIALEYEEVFSWKFHRSKSNLFLDFIKSSENVIVTQVYYYWRLITVDPDDNKFVDCAIAANVDYIVSNDKHFNILNELKFPKVDCIKIEEFIEILKAVR